MEACPDQSAGEGSRGEKIAIFQIEPVIIHPKTWISLVLFVHSVVKGPVYMTKNEREFVARTHRNCILNDLKLFLFF